MNAADRWEIALTDGRLSSLLIASGFGPRHVEGAAGVCRWPDPSITRRLLDAVIACHTIVICGPTGVGKGQLACCLARHLIQRTWPWPWKIRRVGMPAWFRQIKSGAQIAQYVSPIDLLVIDELHHTDAGAGEQREPGHTHTIWERGRLFELIDGRYEARRPTVMTTNMDPDKLNRALDVPVLDRIREAGTVFDLSSWPNRRGA